MEISKVDKNFELKKIILKGKLIKVPSNSIKLYGLSYDEKIGFYRIPINVAKKVSEGVEFLNKNTAGGRIAFKTNSSSIAIHVKYDESGKMAHMPLISQGGFALLEVINNQEKFICNLSQNFSDDYGFSASHELRCDKKMHDYVLYFPLYNIVKSLDLEIDKTSEIYPIEIYKYKKPILYYGSSITQGGCAGRADTTYQSLISKSLRVDQINLGFSGNARGEQAISDYLASLDPIIFVMDYDHNSRSFEELKNTHEKMYLTFRKKHLNTPIIILTAPNYHNDPKEFEVRKNIIYATYLSALNRGDKNVYFIDGSKIYPSDLRECCSVDGVHPNDIGFYFFMKAILKVINKYKLI